MSFLRPRKNYLDKRQCVPGRTLGRGAFGHVDELQEYSESGKPIDKAKHRRVAKCIDTSVTRKDSSDSSIRIGLTPEERKIVAEREASRHARALHLGVKELMKDSDDNYYLVMRKMPGVTLADVIGSLNAGLTIFTPLQYIRLSLALLHALQQQVHGRKLIHRDIKPGNIMVDMSNPDDPIVNIIDYGLARKVNKNDTGVRCGTRKYVAPEVLKGKGSSTKSDVFSLGLCFYYLYFQEGNDYAVNIDDTFYSVDFRADFNGARNLLLVLIERMCDADLSDRHDVNQAITELHRARLKLKRMTLGRSFHYALNYAYSEALKVKNNLAAARNITAIQQIIQRTYFSDEPRVVEEFIDTLGVRALYGCRTKQEIADKIEKIENDYNEQRGMLENIKRRIDAFKIKYKGSKLFKKENLGGALDQYKQVVERKLDKYQATYYQSLDEYARATDRMKEAFNNFPNVFEILVEERCHVMVDRMNNLAGMRTDIREKLWTLMTKLQTTNVGEDRGLEFLKITIRAGISEYLKNTMTQENLLGHTRCVSKRRIKDMYSILDIVNKAQDVDGLNNGVKERLTAIKTGIFGFSGFFGRVFGNSELRDQVEYALKKGMSRARP